MDEKESFWVKFEADDVAEVSFENCENVGAFIKACKSQIGIETRVGNLRLFLKQNKNDKCLPPGLTIDLLLSQIGNVGRYYDNPLYLHVKENPATITVPSLPGMYHFTRFRIIGSRAKRYFSSCGTQG